MSTPTNTKLYNEIKNKAKKKFEYYPSLYASSWINKEYRKRGGTYKEPKPKDGGGTGKWYREKWVQVEEYLKKGVKTDCGSSIKKTKACRPLVRIDKTTPITIPELLKIHDKKILINISRRKQKDMKGRLNWKLAKFYPSK